MKSTNTCMELTTNPSGPFVVARLIAGLAGALLALSSNAALAKNPAPVATFPQGGAQEVTMYVDPGLPAHTIYRPEGVSSARPMPIVAWANGGCATVGNRYRRFLTDIASQRMLVIAIGTIGAKRFEEDLAAEPFQPTRPPRPDDPVNSESSELTKAINWAIAENGRKGSRYYRRIDTRRIAVMGHSCGGLQALAVASKDPRITTTILMNSGVLNQGSGGLPGADVTKASLSSLRGPIAYLSGDASDDAQANARDDFGRITSIPVVWAYRGGTPHTGMYWTEPKNDDYARVAGAWLRWQLMGDKKARAMFRGKHCALCSDPNWTFARKNIR